MPGKRITDHQVHKYKQHRNKLTQVAAAAKTGTSERSARRIDNSQALPSQRPARSWRTREDPLALAWESQVVPDFSRGELIDLELRARGYIVDLLRDCPLTERQRIEDEPEGEEFEARVFARLPSSGQLLRWLLGCGDNVEVVGPVDLRRLVAVQAGKVAALYT